MLIKKFQRESKHFLRLLLISTLKEKHYVENVLLSKTTITDDIFKPKNKPQKYATQKFKVVIPKDAVIDPEVDIYSKSESETKKDSVNIDKPKQETIKKEEKEEKDHAK